MDVNCGWGVEAVDDGDWVTMDLLGGTKAVVHAGAARRRRARNCFIMVAVVFMSVSGAGGGRTSPSLNRFTFQTMIAMASLIPLLTRDISRDHRKNEK